MDISTPQNTPTPSSTPTVAVPSGTVASSPQPVFYSLTPDASPAPSPMYKKKQIWVLGISTLAAMVIAGIIVVVVMNTLNTRSAQKQEVENKTEQMTELVENGASQTEAARAVGLADGCKGLTGEEYANCVSLIAFDEQDPNVCAELTDVAKITCTDGALLVQAKTSKDYKACDKITDEIMKASCQATVRTAALAAEDCTGYGVPVEYCDSQKLLAAALAGGDPEACQTLPEDMRGTCGDIFVSRDGDSDGLTLSEEFAHGTSDQNPDTDGDGYTDGEEIASGHDPLKK